MKTARRYNKELIAERGLEAEAQVLEIIRDMLASPYGVRLTIKDITTMFVERHGLDYERKITAKWIGTIIRKKLRLQARRERTGFVVPASEATRKRLAVLYTKYGIGLSDAEESEADPKVDADVVVGNGNLLGAALLEQWVNVSEAAASLRSCELLDNGQVRVHNSALRSRPGTDRNPCGRGRPLRPLGPGATAGSCSRS